MAAHDYQSGGPHSLGGIVHGLVATAVGAACYPLVTPTVNYCWGIYSGGVTPAPEWATNSIANTLPAIALGLIVFFSTRLASRAVIQRRHSTAKAKGDRLAVYVAQLEGDDANATVRRAVIDTIALEFGPQGIEVIPAGVELRLKEDVSDDVAAELVAKEARALLAKNHGDLLIWGRVHSFGEKTSIELRFVSGTLDGAKRPRFMLTETILLEPKFLAQTGSALAAIVAVAARPLTDDRGRYPAKKLIPIATKLHSLVQNLPEAMDSKSRAQIQNAFGAIKATIGYRSNDAAALKEAVVAYREALKEWRRAGELLNCATTQNNLGNALLTLGEQEPGTARLQEAVAAYREALKERTRERVPLDWAETQTSLGVALAALGERESGTTRFQEAIAVHREALKEWTRERVPLDWAKAQNNLGAALTALGEREQSTARLEEAVTTFREALKEWTRERVPLDWATTQSNLGNALDALPGTTRTEEALAAYREALKERTRERVPLDWASTQVSLGAALGTLGESEPGTTRLEEAVAAIRQALKERTRERVPLDWAHTQYGLGMVLCMLGVRLGGDDGVARLQEAESAFEGAREVLRKTNTEFYVDMTKEILDEAIAGTKVLLESLQLGTV